MISLLLLMSLECSVAVSGPVDVYAKAYYLHENPVGKRYTYTAAVMKNVSGVVSVQAQGHPVAIEWYARPYGVTPSGGYELVSTCGVVPNPVVSRIFSDGFEGGSTIGWSRTVGGK